MGAGKSTIGPLLAERLGGSFIDLDTEIERAEGKTVSEIFEESGEARFRELEREHLRRISAGARNVVALGGGTYIDVSNREYVDQHGCSVYLDTSLATVHARIEKGSRPLFSNPDRADDLYRERLPSYRMARVHVETDGVEPGTVVERILETLGQP